MQELLIIKLRNYLTAHYPDRLLALEEEGKEEAYIREQVESLSGEIEAMLSGETPAYMVEIYCMDVFIQSLGPSKYDYICDILEEEFADDHSRLEASDILLFEVVNMIAVCGLAEGFDEEDKLLRYDVIGAIDNYLHHPQTVGHGV